MKTFYLLLLTVCGFVLVLGACKKHDVQSTSTYSITNATPYKVTFDMYPGKEDYVNYTNRSFQYFVEPGAILDLKLEALKTYWIDWYNADFTVNNWVDSTQPGSDAMPRPKLPVAIVDDRFSLRTTYRDTSRSVLLNGNGVSTTWKSVVTTLPAINGTHTFTFRRDFQCLYTYTDPTGGSVNRQFWYFISNSLRTTANFRLYIRTDQNFYFALMDFNSPSNKKGRDTLMTTYYNGSTVHTGTYPAVRQ